MEEEYTGWKEGKAWWSNHGPHVPEYYHLVDGSKIVCCNVCDVALYPHEFTVTPLDNGTKPFLKMHGSGSTDRDFYPPSRK